MKTPEQIADEALRAANRVINNNVTAETCPEKKGKPEWVREKVRGILAAKLTSVGPSEIKA